MLARAERNDSLVFKVALRIIMRSEVTNRGLPRPPGSVEFIGEEAGDFSQDLWM